MLLSPTLPYSWSFPWQITEQQFHPVGLTLEKLGLLPKRAGPLFSFSLWGFFPFPPPKSIQIASFAAICSLPLGLMLLLRSPWHGAVQACAHLHLLSFWQHWSLPAHRSLQVCFRSSTSPSVSCLPSPQAYSQKMICHLPLFNIFSPNITYSHAYRESTHRSFTLLACSTTNAKYACDKNCIFLRQMGSPVSLSDSLPTVWTLIKCSPVVVA